MCTALLPPGGYTIAVKYTISYHIIYHISYHISYHIYHIISYHIYHIISYHISHHIISYIISYHIMSYHIIWKSRDSLSLTITNIGLPEDAKENNGHILWRPKECLNSHKMKASEY